VFIKHWKEKNNEKTKVELFFLLLMVVIFLIVYLVSQLVTKASLTKTFTTSANGQPRKGCPYDIHPCYIIIGNRRGRVYPRPFLSCPFWRFWIITFSKQRLTQWTLRIITDVLANGNGIAMPVKMYREVF
jgi:hypothetical protein